MMASWYDLTVAASPKNPEHVHTVQPPAYALPPPPKHRKALNTERRSVAVQQMMASSHDLTVAASSSSFGQTNLSHEAHVPYWRVIGRTDIQGTKSAHSPASYLRPPALSETPKNPEHAHTVQPPPASALPPTPKHRKALNTERRSVAVQHMMASWYDLSSWPHESHEPSI